MAQKQSQYRSQFSEKLGQNINFPSDMPFEEAEKRAMAKIQMSNQGLEAAYQQSIGQVPQPPAQPEQVATAPKQKSLTQMELEQYPRLGKMAAAVSGFERGFPGADLYARMTGNEDALKDIANFAPGAHKTGRGVGEATSYLMTTLPFAGMGVPARAAIGGTANALLGQRGELWDAATGGENKLSGSKALLDFILGGAGEFGAAGVQKAATGIKESVAPWLMNQAVKVPAGEAPIGKELLERGVWGRMSTMGKKAADASKTLYKELRGKVSGAGNIDKKVVADQMNELATHFEKVGLQDSAETIKGMMKHFWNKGKALSAEAAQDMKEAIGKELSKYYRMMRKNGTVPPTEVRGLMEKYTGLKTAIEKAVDGAEGLNKELQIYEILKDAVREKLMKPGSGAVPQLRDVMLGNMLGGPGGFAVTAGAEIGRSPAAKSGLATLLYALGKGTEKGAGKALTSGAVRYSPEFFRGVTRSRPEQERE